MQPVNKLTLSLLSAQISTVPRLERPPAHIKLEGLVADYPIFASRAAIDIDQVIVLRGEPHTFMYHPTEGLLRREAGMPGAGEIYAEEDIKNFSDKKGLFVGTGSIGGGIFAEAILLGAGAGAEGRLDLIEPGLGDVSNIPRQALNLQGFDAGQLEGGEPKVQSAIRYAQSTNPFAKVVGHNMPATPENLRDILTNNEFDYVIMGADASQPLVNYTLLDLCNELEIPVFGGLDVGETGISFSMIPGQPSPMRNALTQVTAEQLASGEVNALAFLAKMLDPKHLNITILSDILAVIAQQKSFLSQSRDASGWVGRTTASSILHSFSLDEKKRRYARPYRHHNHRTGDIYQGDPLAQEIIAEYETERESWIRQHLDFNSTDFVGNPQLAQAFLMVLGVTIEDLINGRNPIEA